MGGMQVLQWTAAYPERVFSALPVACSTRHSAQNIAFHELGRQAVMADPDWHHGRYFERFTHPHRGLAVARMAGHITYLSDAALHRKFGRRMQDRDLPTFSFDADFQVESYLRYQGSPLSSARCNSYLYLTRAMDYFDIAADWQLAQRRFAASRPASAWCRSLRTVSRPRIAALVHALNASSARVSFRSEIDRATTPSCSTCRVYTRAFLNPQARRRVIVRVVDMALQEQALPLGGHARSHGQDRTDLLVADMIDAARRCSTAAADGDGCSHWRAAASTAAASNCRARASTAASPGGLRWCRAMPTPTSSIIPTTPRLRDPVADAAGDAAAEGRAGEPLRSAGAPSSRSRTSASGRCGCSSWSAATCRARRICRQTWYDTANIHFCTIKDFVELCDAINVKMERAVALDLYGRPVPLNLPWWVWNMFGEQGVFAEQGAGREVTA